MANYKHYRLCLIVIGDAPYPELKKSHTMARVGPAVHGLQAARGCAGVGGD